MELRFLGDSTKETMFNKSETLEQAPIQKDSVASKPFEIRNGIGVSISYFLKLTAVVLLFLTLVGCSSSSKQPTFEASIGTYNVGEGNLGTSIHTAAYEFPTSLNEELQIAITGPSNWNNNGILTDNFSIIDGGLWSWIATESISPITGKYTFTTTIEGKVYTDTATLNSLDTLQQTKNINLNDTSPTTIVISWDAVPNAKQYLIGIYEGDDLLEDSIFTSQTKITFTSAKLNLNQSYLLYIRAFSEVVNDFKSKGNIHASRTILRFELF